MNLKKLKIAANEIICCDFDGVIHSYTTGWHDDDTVADPPVEGAIEWVKQHIPRPGYDGPVIQVYSTRSQKPEGIAAMKRWFLKYGLTEEELSKIEFPTQKPIAHIFIDDRCIQFDGEFPTNDDIVNFEPWFE